MMKRCGIFWCLIPLFLALVLGGCADVPEDVAEQYHGMNEAVDTESRCIETSELNEDADAALQEDHHQIRPDKGITFDLSSEIYRLHFTQRTDFEENYMEVFRLFFDEETIADQTIVDSESANGMISKSFDNEADQIYCCVGDNGFIAMLGPSAYERSFSHDTENLKIYHIDREEVSDDKYMLRDGAYSIREAVVFVENWINENYKQYEPDFDFKVKTIIVRKDELSCYFDITVEASYKGVPLDNLAIVCYEDDPAKCKYITHEITIDMYLADEIGSFTNGSGLIHADQSDPIERILSLNTALDYCESTFSAYNEIKISDINLKYVLQPEYLPDEEKTTFYLAGRTFSSYPVWELVINVSPKEITAAGEVNTFGDVRKYIYINAVSGELDYDFQGVLQ